MYCGSKHTRELFHRACSSSHDQINYLLLQWEDYERAQGSLETWNDYLRRSDRYRQIALQKEEAQQKRSSQSLVEFTQSAQSAQSAQPAQSVQDQAFFDAFEVWIIIYQLICYNLSFLFLIVEKVSSIHSFFSCKRVYS